MKGVDSGNSTSTLVVPSPTIAVLQIALALAVVCACSLPEVQTGRPFALIAPFLSVSMMTSWIAGGWV